MPRTRIFRLPPTISGLSSPVPFPPFVTLRSPPRLRTVTDSAGAHSPFNVRPPADGLATTDPANTRVSPYGIWTSTPRSAETSTRCESCISRTRIRSSAKLVSGRSRESVAQKARTTRSLSDIAVRNEAKEVWPDARPQAGKNRRCIRWNTLRIFSGRERRRWPQIVRRSRTVNVGQAPKAWSPFRQKIDQQTQHDADQNARGQRKIKTETVSLDRDVAG